MVIPVLTLVTSPPMQVPKNCTAKFEKFDRIYRIPGLIFILPNLVTRMSTKAASAWIILEWGLRLPTKHFCTSTPTAYWTKFLKAITAMSSRLWLLQKVNDVTSRAVRVSSSYRTLLVFQLCANFQIEIENRGDLRPYAKTQ